MTPTNPNSPAELRAKIAATKPSPTPMKPTTEFGQKPDNFRTETGQFSDTSLVAKPPKPPAPTLTFACKHTLPVGGFTSGNCPGCREAG